MSFEKHIKALGILCGIATTVILLVVAISITPVQVTGWVCCAVGFAAAYCIIYWMV